MKILSIDNAANASGWSYWEDEKPIVWGVIYPNPKSAKDGARLTSLRKQFSLLIDEHNPDIVLIESPVGDDGPESNWRTMSVLFEVFGILRQLIDEKGKKISIISVSSWQNACGIHKRDRIGRKAGAVTFVERTYGLKDLEQDIIDSICLGHYFIVSTKRERSAFND